MHILAIRFSSLGDVVLQSSTISWLRQQYPEAKISFLTANEFTGLLRGHPHLDNVIGMQRFSGFKGILQLRSFIVQLHKTNRFDLIIDLHGTTRSFFIKLFLPFVKKISIDKRRFERALLVKSKINLLKETPSIHSRNILDLAHLLGRDFNKSELENFINQNSKTSSKISSKMSLTSTPLSYQEDNSPLDGEYIVLSPVASFENKRWPIEYFAKLAELIINDNAFEKFKVVVLAGTKDEYCQGLEFLQQKYSQRFLYLQGKTNLLESMQYLKYCSLCIGNDTGLNHIAEAHGVPVITIFGPTHESFGFKAHLENSMNLSVELNCRPCSTTGKGKCKLDQQLCMLNISPEDVWEKSKSVLLKQSFILQQESNA